MRYRKSVFVVLEAFFILFAGCGVSKEQSVGDTVVEAVQETETETVQKEQHEKDLQESESIVVEEQVPCMNVEVSREEKTVEMPLEEVRLGYSCAADETYIYLYQASDYGEPGIYRMQIGGESLERLPVDIPEGMDVNRLAVDCYGTLYVQVSISQERKAAGEEQQHLIWILNENYEIEETLDITKEVEERMPPAVFAVDGEGRYWLQWGYYSVKVCVLDQEGKVLHSFTEESFGVDEVSIVGAGDQGKIYIVCNTEGTAAFAAVDTESGNIETSIEIPFLPDEIGRAIGKGTDTEVLLSGDMSGIWAVDLEKNTTENRNTFSERGVGYDTSVLSRTFLPDGRLFVNEIIMENGQLTKYRFLYIPAGK